MLYEVITVEYLCPPSLPEATVAEIDRNAKGIYRALGCRDFSRIDFSYNFV